MSSQKTLRLIKRKFTLGSYTHNLFSRREAELHLNHTVLILSTRNKNQNFQSVKKLVLSKLMIERYKETPLKRFGFLEVRLLEKAEKITTFVKFREKFSISLIFSS